MGGAAILLSNRHSVRRSSKYQFMNTVHNTISSDLSYGIISYEEDPEGYRGITVTKDFLNAAETTIRPNITLLVSQVLPVSEKLRYILTSIAMYLNIVESKPYVPDFNKAFEHFLPHVGAKSVLDALQKTLKIPEICMEASRMTLNRFGNTSSSSTWHELTYIVAKERIKKGDRVWQMAFGSGFKCFSVVWRAIRTVDREEMNPWD